MDFAVAVEKAQVHAKVGAEIKAVDAFTELLCLMGPLHPPTHQEEQKNLKRP